MHIGFATTAKYADLTADDRLAIAALERAGHTVAPLVWDAGVHDAPPLVIIRSCWNYHHLPDEFLTWTRELERRGVLVMNPAAVIETNMRKTYLDELAAQGVRTPRTVYLSRGQEASLAQVMGSAELAQAVIKPTCSLGGWETWVAAAPEADRHQERFAAAVAARDMMVQEFVAPVLTEGELSLVYFGGRYSHTVRKRPAQGEFRIHEAYGGLRDVVEPTKAQLAAAERALACIAEPLLYARVDGVPVGNELVLMELELIDPELLFRFDPLSPGRFAEAVGRFVRSS